MPTSRAQSMRTLNLICAVEGSAYFSRRPNAYLGIAFNQGCCFDPYGPQRVSKPCYLFNIILPLSQKLLDFLLRYRRRDPILLHPVIDQSGKIDNKKFLAANFFYKRNLGWL